MSERCEFLKPDGERCKARARPGRPFCIFHDPQCAQQRTEARRRGGQTRSRPAATLPGDTPDLPLKTVGDVTAALAVTINQTRRGELDPKVANSVAYLAGVLLRTLEVAAQMEQLAEVMQRLAALEEAQKGKRR